MPQLPEARRVKSAGKVFKIFPVAALDSKGARCDSDGEMIPHNRGRILARTGLKLLQSHHSIDVVPQM